MKSTFNICFYAKKDKLKAGGAYPLFARITVDGVASRFNTKLDVLPEMWDGKAGKAIGRTAEAGRINRMLSDINASLNTIYHEMQRRDNYVTAEKVKNEFLGHSENHETILTLFQKHNEDVKQLVGISKTIATYRKYEVTRRHLAEFIQSKYNLSDISIREITPMFITDFELYLRTACKCGYNTTAKFMQFFKRIIIIARNNGILAVQLSIAGGETCPCPKCGSGRILFYPKVAKCSNVDCTLTIFRNKCDKQLTDKQVVELVTKRKTGLIKGFKGKNGKVFDASLVLDEQFNVAFSFPEKKGKPKK